MLEKTRMRANIQFSMFGMSEKAFFDYKKSLFNKKVQYENAQPDF